jgi:hypothetical protein
LVVLNSQHADEHDDDNSNNLEEPLGSHRHDRGPAI